jgi:hypothetical protein
MGGNLGSEKGRRFYQQCSLRMHCIGIEGAAVKLSYKPWQRLRQGLIYQLPDVRVAGPSGPEPPRPAPRSFPMSNIQIGLLLLFGIAAFGCITLYIDFVHERRRGEKSLGRDHSPTRR